MGVRQRPASRWPEVPQASARCTHPRVRPVPGRTRRWPLADRGQGSGAGQHRADRHGQHPDQRVPSAAWLWVGDWARSSGRHCSGANLGACPADRQQQEWNEKSWRQARQSGPVMGFNNQMIAGGRCLLHLHSARPANHYQSDKPALCRGPGHRELKQLQISIYSPSLPVRRTGFCGQEPLHPKVSIEPDYCASTAVRGRGIRSEHSLYECWGIGVQREHHPLEHLLERGARPVDSLLDEGLKQCMLVVFPARAQ